MIWKILKKGAVIGGTVLYTEISLWWNEAFALLRKKKKFICYEFDFEQNKPLFWILHHEISLLRIWKCEGSLTIDPDDLPRGDGLFL